MVSDVSSKMTEAHNSVKLAIHMKAKKTVQANVNYNQNRSLKSCVPDPTEPFEFKNGDQAASSLIQ